MMIQIASSIALVVVKGVFGVAVLSPVVEDNAVVLLVGLGFLIVEGEDKVEIIFFICEVYHNDKCRAIIYLKL